VLNIVCAEHTDADFTCTCPGTDHAVTVLATGTFPGCPGPAPTVSEIVAQVSDDHVTAVITDNVKEVNSVTVKSKDKNTITLGIDSTTDVSTFEPALKDSIAKVIGDQVSASDVSIAVTPGKKRVLSVVTATINDPTSSGFRLNALLAIALAVCAFVAF